MKSKLTLRLDERVKEQAKRLAEERGTSVSKIVEDYFRLLLREHADQYDEGRGRTQLAMLPTICRPGRDRCWRSLVPQRKH